MLLRHFVVVYLISLIANGEIIDYCSYCDGGTHTLCKYPKPEPSENCKGYDIMGLNKKQKQELLEMHNEIRNYVASGYETRGSPGPQPEASNMKKLKWDDELAEIAQRWASQCTTEINKRNDECRKTAQFDVGQNIVGILTTETSPDFRTLLSDWYNQVEYVSEDDVKNYTKSEVRRIDSYTQMVWANTEYLGCGFSSFQPQLAYDNMDRFHLHKLVCNYGPQGNTPGQCMYKIGKGCAACEHCDRRFLSICRDISSPEDSKEVIDHFYSKFPKFFQNVKQKEPYKENQTSESYEEKLVTESSASESSEHPDRTVTPARTLKATTFGEVIGRIGFDKMFEMEDPVTELDYDMVSPLVQETTETVTTSTETSTSPQVEIWKARGLWLGDRFGKTWSVEPQMFKRKYANRNRHSSLIHPNSPIGDLFPKKARITSTKSSSLFSLIQKNFGLDEEDVYKEFEKIVHDVQKKNDKDGTDCYCYYRLSSQDSGYSSVIANVILLCFIPLAVIMI